MSDDKAVRPNSDTEGDPSLDGRRKGDRRVSQQPFEGPDRRTGDRRSGKDRRQTKRKSVTPGDAVEK